MAAVLARHMEGREFIVGTHAGVVDFVTGYTLDWANEARLLGDYPGLRAYMERMYAAQRRLCASRLPSRASGPKNGNRRRPAVFPRYAIEPGRPFVSFQNRRPQRQVKEDSR
jgi:hypothetical protein